MKKSTREIGAELLYEILENGAYANILLNKALGGFSEQRDKAFVTNLVYGALQRYAPVDYQLHQFVKKPIKKKDAMLEVLLRAALYELLFSAAKPYAVVNEYVKLGKKMGNPGWGSMLNGVLRNVLRRKEELVWPDFETEPDKAAFFISLPGWLTPLWQREYGEETALRLVKSMEEERFPVIRVNTLKTEREALRKFLSEQGIPAEEGDLSEDALRLGKGAELYSLPEKARSLFVVQEESSQLVARVLAPDENSTVLDLCAAPGGKTTHMAQMMKNTGKIYASDLYEHKVKLIRENADRLGITNIEAVKKDGTQWGKDAPERFDFVLLDAPCSGLGVMNRRSDSRLHKKEEDIHALAKLQRELMISAYRALRPGGAMVYSTCTLSGEENRGNVRWFLEEFSDMKPSPFAHRISNLSREEQKEAEDGYLELLPFAHQTDGFFIARFVKDER